MLTFNTLRDANIRRVGKFKNKHGEPAHSKSDGSDWDVATWLMAAIGEMGELAHARLKYEAGATTFDQYRQEFADELADVVTYLDITARRGLDEAGQNERYTEPKLFLNLMALMGEMANSCKKYFRGDIDLDEYNALKGLSLVKMRHLMNFLENPQPTRPVQSRVTDEHGIDLGEAVRYKFNAVSARVGVNIQILQTPPFGECEVCDLTVKKL